MIPLPIEVVDRLQAFLTAGGTGQLVLDIKDGRIVGWKLTESVRIDRRQIAMK